MQTTKKYGWTHREAGVYTHQCGANVLKSRGKWTVQFVDGSNHACYATAQQAINHAERFDPEFWAFDDQTGFAATPLGGVMIDSGIVDSRPAFTVRTCSRFPLEQFTEPYFRKKFFAIASCARCSQPMTEFRFANKFYSGDAIDHYPFNPDRRFRNYLHAATIKRTEGKDDEIWQFLVCHCGCPLWIHDEIIKLSVELRVAQNKHDRRQRMKNAEGHYTRRDIELLLQKQEGSCFYCKIPIFAGHNLTIDHIIPLARGGTHWPDNICLACKSCNSAKGDLMPDIFQENCVTK